MKNNTTLASYSLKCSRYLKQDHIKSLFDKKFALRIIKFQTEKLKKFNRTQGHRNTTLITSQCNDEYYDELVSGSKSHETLEEREDREDQENGEIDEDEEAEFPSDLTFDHHPQRTADYFLLHDDFSEEIDEQSNDDDWIIGNFNVSDISSLSDIRLLSLNDIYIFDESIDESVTKYFGVGLHKVVMSDISFNCYRPHRPNKSHVWCLEIAENPPDDLMSALKLCTDFLIQATKQDNEVDLHMAHTLTQLLSVFVASSHDSSVEDSYVHHYLAPILQSVYRTDKKFNVRWANGALNEDSIFKPDFQVSSRIINIRCIVIVTEFKPKSHNSAVESGLIKLGKQMKLMYNNLIEKCCMVKKTKLNRETQAQKRVPKPTVYGLISQGKNLNTYVMDMSSPYTYRMVKLSKTTLCRNIEELHLLPAFISKLIQVKSTVTRSLI
ncbi:uncharacterized protein BX663DRAFT_484271 [Cokeromyces recurvatus]|uniref:uncharacterized protein n=1 Tax=Cokeromyces recurvatus TaxID=90255 RepID=UPI0022205656|nr:uncharacterized protein BX663DRAFT_484271 [Cokeromyces recurvatus]KAI7904908.1 hypothetical protein BX663DRAFT_484271 [Cokeromyces recurvatus]